MTIQPPPITPSQQTQSTPSVDLLDLLSRVTRIENEKMNQSEIEKHYLSVKQIILPLLGVLALIATITEIRIDAKLKETYKDLYSNTATSLQRQIDSISQKPAGQSANESKTPIQ